MHIIRIMVGIIMLLSVAGGAIADNDLQKEIEERFGTINIECAFQERGVLTIEGVKKPPHLFGEKEKTFKWKHQDNGEITDGNTILWKLYGNVITAPSAKIDDNMAEKLKNLKKNTTMEWEVHGKITFYIDFAGEIDIFLCGKMVKAKVIKFNMSADTDYTADATYVLYRHILVAYHYDGMNTQQGVGRNSKKMIGKRCLSKNECRTTK